MHRYLWVLIIGSICVSPSAAQDINADQLKPVHLLTGHEKSITAIAVSPDSKTLATSSYDNTLRLWDLETGKPKLELRNQADTVEALRFSPDSSLLAAAYKDRTLRLWDAAAGKEKVAINDLSERTVLWCVLRFSPDGKTLASATGDRLIRLWDVSSGKMHVTIETGHRTRAYDLLFSPDGRFLASDGYYDLKLWDLSGNEIGTVDGELSTMRFSGDGKTLTSAIGHKVSLWAIADGEEPLVIQSEDYHSHERFRALLSPDGKSLATVDKDLIGVALGRGLAPAVKQRCRLIVMDLKTRKERTLYETRGSKNWFVPIGYTANGEVLALLNRDDKSIMLVGGDSGKLLARLQTPDGEKFRRGTPPSMLFSPDGEYFIAAHGSSISVWQVPSENKQLQ